MKHQMKKKKTTMMKKKLCEFNILLGLSHFEIRSRSALVKQREEGERRHSLTQNKPDALLNRKHFQIPNADISYFHKFSFITFSSFFFKFIFQKETFCYKISFFFKLGDFDVVDVTRRCCCKNCTMEVEWMTEVLLC